MDKNKVRCIAFMQLPYLHLVVTHRIHTSGLQYMKYIDPFCNGPRAEFVDMPGGELIGMFIIAPKHDHIRILVQEWNEGIKIFGGTAFADDDLHAVLQFFMRFFVGETFMVRGDTTCDVIFCIITAESGCMSVYRFADCLGRRNFSQHFGVSMQRPWEIHHLTQVINGGVPKQGFNIIAVEDGSGRFKLGSRYATRCAKMKFERYRPAVADHEIDTIHPTDVGDFVGIADGSHGAMGNGEPREF